MSISTHKLFEFVVAAMLRESGYVAGVPISFVQGRGGEHQLDAVGIEFNRSPFQYDSILVAEAKCYDPSRKDSTIGIEIVRELKSVLIDLEQTLPRALKPIPRGRNPLWYFTDLIGIENNITARYCGAIFSTTEFTRPAREFAYAHAIFLFHFPPIVSGKKVNRWMTDLLVKLKELNKNNKKLRLLLRRKKNLLSYPAVLRKLFSEGYNKLDASERHYLFTIIRLILSRDKEFSRFWEEIRLNKIFSVNGYPVLASMERISPYLLVNDVIEHLSSMHERRKWYKKIGQRYDFGKFRLELLPPSRADEFTVVLFQIRTPKRQKPLVSGRLYLPSFLVERLGQEEFTLNIPLREGLDLVAKTSMRMEEWE